MDQEFAIKFYGAMLAVMNPFVILPIFLGMTEGLTGTERRKIVLRITFFAAVMSTAVALAGQQILSFFSIGIDDFRVAGGALMLMIGFSMLNGRDSTAHRGTEREREHQVNLDDIAFYPMTFPMCVGPGTITALILFMQEAHATGTYLTYTVVVVASLIGLGVVLYFGEAIGRRLSRTIRVIMTRMMGMILTAIAVAMVTSGLKNLLPGLAG